MLPRLLRSRVLPSLVGARSPNAARSGGASMVLKRTLIAAPKAGDPPLMSRRADRELPGASPSEQLTDSY
jgi:cytochrome c oxidase assembly factor 1